MLLICVNFISGTRLCKSKLYYFTINNDAPAGTNFTIDLDFADEAGNRPSQYELYFDPSFDYYFVMEKVQNGSQPLTMTTNVSLEGHFGIFTVSSQLKPFIKF